MWSRRVKRLRNGSNRRYGSEGMQADILGLEMGFLFLVTSVFPLTDLET